MTTATAPPIPATAIKQVILLQETMNGLRLAIRRKRKRKRSQKLPMQKRVTKILPTPGQKNLGVAHLILRIPTRTQILPRDRNHQ